MEPQTMVKSLKVLCVALAALQLSACVTQQYGEENTPIVENDATQNDIAMTRISLGLGYLKMGNTAQAKLNLEKAKRFAPNLVQVHTAFAHYYDSVGEFDLATQSYEEALSIESDDPDTLNNYGVFLCRQGEIDKAEEQFLKAIAVPSYILVAKSYENLALCQLGADKFSKAELYLEKAILHSPSNASSLKQMAQLQYAKTDYKQAIVFIKRYERSTRKFSPDALALAYKVFEKNRQKNIAKNYAGMLVKLFPNSYEAKQYLLNGLDEIEADKLAEKYRKTVNGGKKKRVVKLSPKKPSPVQQTEAVKVKPKNLPKPVESTKLQTNNAQNVSAPVQVSEPKPKRSAESPVTMPIHIVQPGESFFTISRKYNILMSSLLSWNKMKESQVLQIGDVIYLADPKKVAKK